MTCNESLLVIDHRRVLHYGRGGSPWGRGGVGSFDEWRPRNNNKIDENDASRTAAGIFEWVVYAPCRRWKLKITINNKILTKRPTSNRWNGRVGDVKNSGENKLVVFKATILFEFLRNITLFPPPLYFARISSFCLYVCRFSRYTSVAKPPRARS